MDLSSYYFINTPASDLSVEQFNVLVAQGVERKYIRGEEIFSVGDNPKGVFFVKKGKVKIFQRLSSGLDQIMNIHIEGEIIGYRPLLCHERYPVTATTLEPCLIVFIPKKNFFGMLEHSTQFSNLLLKYLSHEFTVWVNAISLLTHATVKERLLLNLLILVAKYQEASTWPVRITLSKGDIASLIGTSNETLARILTMLKSDQLIASKNGAIEITGQQQLKKIQKKVSIFLD